MTAFTLARRTAVRYKTRSILAVAGVAIIGALNFDMLLLSRGLLLSFADMVRAGGYDVRVLGSTGLPGLRLPVVGASKLADEMAKLPEVSDVAVIRLEQAWVSAPGQRERAVTLIGSSRSGDSTWRIVRGRNLGAAPAGVLPLVVARPLAAAFHTEPGSTLQIRPTIHGEASVLPAVAGQVVGVADFGFDAAGDFTVATTSEGLDMVRGSPGQDDAADVILASSNPETGIDAAVLAIARLRPDVRVFSNEALIEQFNRNGFSYFRQISAVLSATTAVFSVLLVATLLTVSVNQRLGEIAALRAIGIARANIAGMLLCESAWLVGAGGLIALPLGGAMATMLDNILRRMPGLPEQLHFFVYEPRAVVLHGVLLVATAVAAAAYPIWLATTLPISATLRRELVS